MNTTSASRADTPARPSILVWDAPVRVFHWLMVLSFAGAWLTAESERWRLLHVTLGYTMAGLVVFRIVWGLIGTRHARFSDFVRGPRAVWHDLSALLHGRPQHHLGHTPAGAVAILTLLGLTLVVTALGWATYNGLGGHALEEAHEAAATLMLGVVAVHVIAVVVTSLLRGENLVRAMVTGRKPGDPQHGIRRAWVSLAVVMLAAVLGYWSLQWQSRPTVAAGASPAVAARAGEAGSDDDQD
jgi:cytochrome b